MKCIKWFLLISVFMVSSIDAFILPHNLNKKIEEVLEQICQYFYLQVNDLKEEQARYRHMPLVVNRNKLNDQYQWGKNFHRLGSSTEECQSLGSSTEECQSSIKCETLKDFRLSKNAEIHEKVLASKDKFIKDFETTIFKDGVHGSGLMKHVGVIGDDSAKKLDNKGLKKLFDSRGF